MPLYTLNSALLDYIPNHIHRVLPCMKEILYAQTPYLIGRITSVTLDRQILPFFFKSVPTLLYTNSFELSHSAQDAVLEILKTIAQKVYCLEKFSVEFQNNPRSIYLEEMLENVWTFFDRFRYSTLREVSLKSAANSDCGFNLRFLMAMFGGRPDCFKIVPDSQRSNQQPQQQQQQQQYPLLLEQLSLAGNYGTKWDQFVRTTKMFLPNPVHDQQGVLSWTPAPAPYFNLYQQIVTRCPKLKNLTLSHMTIHGNEFESFVFPFDEENEQDRKKIFPRLDRLEISNPGFGDASPEGQRRLLQTNNSWFPDLFVKKQQGLLAVAVDDDSILPDNLEQYLKFCDFYTESLPLVLTTSPLLIYSLRTLVLKNSMQGGLFHGHTTANYQAFPKSCFLAIGNLQVLEVLDLSGPKPHFDDECLLTIAKSCRTLCDIDIGYDKSLKPFYMSSNSGKYDSLTPAGLVKAAPYLANVAAIRLFNVEAATVESVIALIECISDNLSYLDISEWNASHSSALNQSADLVFALARHCKRLRVLSFVRGSASSSCKFLPQLLADNCPLLQRIELRGHDYLTTADCWTYENNQSARPRFTNILKLEQQQQQQQSQESDKNEAEKTVIIESSELVLHFNELKRKYPYVEFACVNL